MEMVMKARRKRNEVKVNRICPLRPPKMRKKIVNLHNRECTLCHSSFLIITLHCLCSSNIALLAKAGEGKGFVTRLSFLEKGLRSLFHKWLILCNHGKKRFTYLAYFWDCLLLLSSRVSTLVEHKESPKVFCFVLSSFHCFLVSAGEL